MYLYLFCRFLRYEQTLPYSLASIIRTSLVSLANHNTWRHHYAQLPEQILSLSYRLSLLTFFGNVASGPLTNLGLCQAALT